jgi:hypothetical protein
MRVLSLCTAFVWNIADSESNSTRYCHKSRNIPANYPLLLSCLNDSRFFSTDFRKIVKYQISGEFVQWEPGCPFGRTDGQIDWHDESLQWNQRDALLFSLLRINGRYMFRALLAHPQEVLHKRHFVYCLRVMSFGCTWCSLLRMSN